MEFVLLAAIFLTSSGFLVGAAVDPTPPPSASSATATVSSSGEMIAPQPVVNVLPAGS
jgi:hypothetical protein